MTRHHLHELYRRRAEAMMRGFDYTPPFPSQVRLLELAAMLERKYRSPLAGDFRLMKFKMEETPWRALS